MHTHTHTHTHREREGERENKQVTETNCDLRCNDKVDIRGHWAHQSSSWPYRWNRKRRASYGKVSGTRKGKISAALPLEAARPACCSRLQSRRPLRGLTKCTRQPNWETHGRVQHSTSFPGMYVSAGDATSCSHSSWNWVNETAPNLGGDRPGLIIDALGNFRHVAAFRTEGNSRWLIFCDKTVAHCNYLCGA